jgi:hypothetical protein
LLGVVHLVELGLLLHLLVEEELLLLLVQVLFVVVHLVFGSE